MYYVNDQHLRSRPIDWRALSAVMIKTLRLFDQGEYTQPLKPYLKYNDPKNRIIAMPAYIGGDFDKAGIKWIASFPDNPKIGLPRAHSVIILNNAQTGRPEAILNSPLPSIVRTATISGLMIRSFLQNRPQSKIQLGIIGWGPIGQHHAQMVSSLFGSQLQNIRIYDQKNIDLDSIPNTLRGKTVVCDYWLDVYEKSNILITCTVSEKRYIDRLPPKGVLLLNISLRDYLPKAASQFKAIVVDDWNEVCRENTDIEQLHLQHHLKQSDTFTLADVVLRNGLKDMNPNEPIFFNPMGLAVFDIATAIYYIELAKKHRLGIILE